MYICVIVIRGPRVHQSPTGSFIYTLGRAPHVLLQLNVHLCCVRRYFSRALFEMKKRDVVVVSYTGTFFHL